MRVTYLLFLASFLFSSNGEKMTNVPACRNCIHFFPQYLNTDFSNTYSKCLKIGDKDNKVYAHLARTDDNLCGKDGKFFEEEKETELYKKIIMHTLFSNLPITTQRAVLTATLFLLLNTKYPPSTRK
jgi:hypothetical protein